MPKLICANPLCGEEVQPSSPFQRDCVFDGKKWYHKQCFVFTFPKKNVEDWLDKTAAHIQAVRETEALFKYIKSEYNLAFISSAIKNRINALSNGESQDIKERISPALLLEMLTYYSSQLTKDRDYRRNSSNENMAVTGYGEPCFRHDLNYVLARVQEYKNKKASESASTVNASAILNTVSPDMSPFYREQQRMKSSRGEDKIQELMDAYWESDEI